MAFLSKGHVQLVYKNVIVNGYIGCLPLYTLIALIIGNMAQKTPSTKNPNKPKPKNNINGKHNKK